MYGVTVIGIRGSNKTQGQGSDLEPLQQRGIHTWNETYILLAIFEFNAYA